MKAEKNGMEKRGIEKNGTEKNGAGKNGIEKDRTERGRKTGRIGQKQMNLIILLLLAVVILMIVYSSWYLQNAIRMEQEAMDRKTTGEELGQTLADASDYLTEEVRKFVITEENSHYDNYWDEVYVTKRRDSVIEKLREMNLLQEENELLEAAKQRSDDLIFVEAQSMQLEFRNRGESAPAVLKPYLREPTEQNRTRKTGESRIQAISLLFDDNYTRQKNIIHQCVDEFQQMLGNRMDEELEKAREATGRAMLVQLLLHAVTICLVVFLIFIIYRYDVYPVMYYGQMLGEHREEEILPGGMSEIYDLGEAILKMYRDMSKALQAKSEFLAVMSHEIRTPLHSMTGYGFLLKRTELTDKQKEYVEYLENASSHLLQIVNNILDYSKLEQHKFRQEETEFSLADFTKEMKSDFSYLCEEKGLDFICSFEGEQDALILGDCMKFKQIAKNLLSNAVKFTEKGQVEARFVQTTEEGKEILLMKVKDTGVGIKEENMDKIFLSFEQADATVSRRFGGTGLGLPICKELLKLLGGGIQVSSVYGEGTQFTVRIPVKMAEKEEKKIEKEEVYRSFQGTALLVEDNEVNGIMQQEILSGFGLKTDLAAGGKEAVKLAGKNKYDIIFMDIRMPVMNGYEAALRIRKEKNCADAVIIALTADAQPETFQKAKAAGMADILTKPVQIEQLSRLLNHYLKKNAQKDDARKDDARKDDAQKDDAQKDDARKDDARKDDARKNDIRKNDAQKDEAEKQEIMDANLDFSENNKMLYKRVRKIFLENHEKDVEKIPRLFREGKKEELEELLHALKGAAAAIGASLFREKCMELEEMLKTGGQEDFLLMTAELGALFCEMKAKQKETVQAAEEEALAKTKDNVGDILNQLETYIEESDFQVVDFFYRNKGCLEELWGEEKTEQAEEMIHHFDYAGLTVWLKGGIGNV